MKRLSILLALSVLNPIPVFANNHRTAIRQLNLFLKSDYSITGDGKQLFERDKQKVQQSLNMLPPKVRSLYSKQINRRQKELQSKFPSKDREYRNHLNAEMNRADKTKNTKQKSKSKKEDDDISFTSLIKEQMLKHPIITLLLAGGLTYGGYKLWQYINTGRPIFGDNRNNQVNEQIQCLLCETQKPRNELVQLSCNHTFCGNCLHDYLNQRDTILTNDIDYNIRVMKRYCPVQDCKQHICGNLCPRTNNCQNGQCNNHDQIVCNRHQCNNHVQPLRNRILVARQNQLQRYRLSNNPMQRNQQPVSWWQTLLHGPLTIGTQSLVQGLLNMLWS